MNYFLNKIMIDSIRLLPFFFPLQDAGRGFRSVTRSRGDVSCTIFRRFCPGDVTCQESHTVPHGHETRKENTRSSRYCKQMIWFYLVKISPIIFLLISYNFTQIWLHIDFDFRRLGHVVWNITEFFFFFVYTYFSTKDIYIYIFFIWSNFT